MADEHDSPNGAADRPGAANPGTGGPRRATRGGRDRELLESIEGNLRLMRPELERVATLTREHAGLLSEALPRLGELDIALAGLRGRVQALEGAEEPDDADGPYEQAALTAAGLLPDPGHQVDWHLMSAEQALPAWEALGAWVATVVCGRLGFTRAQLPDCWALHPRAVHALSWAHQLHRTLAGTGVGALHLAEFDTRWLPHLHARLAAAIALDDEDSRSAYHSSRDATHTSSNARCRLGHYHHLSPDQRKRAETELEQEAKQAAQARQAAHPQQFDSFDPATLTGSTVTPTELRERGGLEASLRALHERRARAQHALDALTGRAAGDPARPRYLPVMGGDAQPRTEGRTRVVDEPAHLARWGGPFREAAAADITARRALRHHQLPDLGLQHLHTTATPHQASRTGPAPTGPAHGDSDGEGDGERWW